MEILRTGTAHNRRAAAEALGRLGNADVVDALLAATKDNSDRILEHSLIYALIELNQPQRTCALLADAVPRTRRATLIALDQMPAGKVSVDDVRPLFDSPEPVLNETAWWLAEHHPEWAGALADHFRRLLAGMSTLADDAGQRLSARLARFASDAQVQAVMAESLKNARLSADVHLAVLNAMAASGLKGVPGPWVAPLVGLLKGTDAKLTSKVLSVVQSLSAAPLDSSFFPRLKEIAADERVPDDVRLQALVILPAAERTIDDGTLRFLCLHLDVSHDVRVRGLAADVLLATTLDGRQLAILTKALVSTGPMELDRLLEAFSKSQDEQVGLALVRLPLSVRRRQRHLRPKS